MSKTLLEQETWPNCQHNWQADPTTVDNRVRAITPAFSSAWNSAQAASCCYFMYLMLCITPVRITCSCNLVLRQVWALKYNGDLGVKISCLQLIFIKGSISLCNNPRSPHAQLPHSKGATPWKWCSKSLYTNTFCYFDSNVVVSLIQTGNFNIRIRFAQLSVQI